MTGVVFMFLFLVIGAIVLVPRYLKSREREQMQATLRAAIERGQPLPPDVIAALTQELPAAATAAVTTAPLRVKPVASPQADMRKGVIWIAVALGIGVLGYMSHWDEGDVIYYGLGFAAIPGLIGLAYLALAAISSSAPKDKSAA